MNLGQKVTVLLAVGGVTAGAALAVMPFDAGSVACGTLFSPAHHAVTHPATRSGDPWADLNGPAPVVVVQSCAPATITGRRNLVAVVTAGAAAEGIIGVALFHRRRLVVTPAT